MRTGIILVLVLVCGNGLAQKKYFDAGLTAGVSYYLGEINPSTQFYSPSPAYGGFLRYNLNKREAFRLSVIHMGIKGSDKDFSNSYQQLRNASFSSSFTEISSTFEFHFLPYEITLRKKAFTPYLFVGISYLTFVNTKNAKGSLVSLPFGMGLKYGVSKKISTGVEWGMRKFFNDNFDGITNPGAESGHSSLNNNDWYSFAGFFISFRLNDNSMDCPVYR